MLTELKADYEIQNPEVNVHLFGGPIVAAGNAKQIRKDAILTGVLAVVLILSLLFWYYRKVLVPLLFILPPLFGLTIAVGGYVYVTR